MWDPQWGWFTKLATLGIYGAFAWGLLFYPLAPYRPCDNGHYCDKRHQYREQADYDGFRRWETTLFATAFVVLMARLVEHTLRKDRETAAQTASSDQETM